MEQLMKKSKFWTVQKREIFTEIQKRGIYYPDFSKSDFVHENPKLSELYNFMLNNYNRINRTNCKGLIFSFFKMNDEYLQFFPDFETFKSFIILKKNAIYAMWKKLLSNDCVILELEVESELNPLFIDINHFQLLMPPIMTLPPYTKDDINMIIDWVKNGKIGKGYENPALIQAHLPYIRIEDVIGVYPTFDLN